MYQTTQHTRLSSWLAQRSASERDTLARVWALAPRTQGAWDDRSLADAILQPQAVQRVIETLDHEARQALERILAEPDTFIPAVVLEREWGSVRSHEQYPNPRAYLLALSQPPSATEKLFTLGLILPFQRSGGRFYVVPEELRPLLPAVAPRDLSVKLPATSAPPRIFNSDPYSLEHNVVTLLALAQRGELSAIPTGGLNKASLLRLAKRWGQDRDDLRGLTHEKHWRYVHFLRSVLEGAGLLRVNTAQELRVTSEGMNWLRSNRVERLQRLLDGWVATPWDELEHFCGITIKGYAFGRDLAATRRDIIDSVRQVPLDSWVAWETLAAEVQRVNPDFMRRDGRYDAWRLVNYRGEHLDGYEHWPDVEGELLKRSIGEVMRLLGLTDLGGTPVDDSMEPTAFRVSVLGAAVLGIGPAPDAPSDEPLVIQGTFEILIPPRVAPRARFWVMCCAHWQSSETVERYTLTKASVQAAAAAGADIDELRQVLEETSGAALPQNVVYSLREWSGQLGQLTLERGTMLRAADPALLEQVRHDKRVRMPDHELLAPDRLLLDDGEATPLAERLRKAGYGLLSEDDAAGPPLSARDLTVLYGALEFYAAACAELGVDGEVSDALRRRVMRLLDQRQRSQALKLRVEALGALHKLTRTSDGSKRRPE